MNLAILHKEYVEHLNLADLTVMGPFFFLSSVELDFYTYRVT